MEMELVMTPDKTEGTVFAVPGGPDDAGGRNSHGDIFIKYDPRTRTGYSLRYWRTTESNAACTYQFYKIRGKWRRHAVERQEGADGRVQAEYGFDAEGDGFDDFCGGNQYRG